MWRADLSRRVCGLTLKELPHMDVSTVKANPAPEPESPTSPEAKAPRAASGCGR